MKDTSLINLLDVEGFGFPLPLSWSTGIKFSYSGVEEQEGEKPQL